jgi:hypothetical protein
MVILTQVIKEVLLIQLYPAFMFWMFSPFKSCQILPYTRKTLSEINNFTKPERKSFDNRSTAIEQLVKQINIPQFKCYYYVDGGLTHTPFNE